MLNELTIKPGSRVKLEKFRADDTSLLRGGKPAAAKQNVVLQERLAHLQNLLYAEHKQKLLVVLQGMDTSGKDGTIRHVMGGFNPLGVRIASFKKPTEQELDHDFLWRIHAEVPANGEVVVFNRSHYEDVLVVRVHDLVPEETWRKRYDQINQFEKMLVENGTTIVKFFLHISFEEQRERLQARVDDPEKRWKFQHGDLEERKFWGEYMKAYRDMLEKTSTEWAPWHVVPADRKWYRNWVVGKVLVDALQKLDMKYPVVELGDVKVE